VSANFGYLEQISPELYRLGRLAERYFAEDANTSLIKSRQFGEYMLREIAALSGAYDPASRETAHELLMRLSAQELLPREVADVLHAVRKRGNEAAHGLGGTPAEALSALRFCRALGVWYRRTYGRDPNFQPGPFVPPRATADIDADTRAELDALRQKVREAEVQLAAANASAEEQIRARAAAEEMARQAAADSAVWEQTAQELEAGKTDLSRRLAELQRQAEAQPKQVRAEFRQAGLQAANQMELDERQTRRLIDVKLTLAGWEADTERLRHKEGARPETGRNMAIAEWPTASGPVDYALFVGRVCVGVIEAKRRSVDIPAALTQAERYARDIALLPEEMAADGPWQHGLDAPFRVPFVFATNGRPYLRQWRSKAGIWYRDTRQPTNQRQAMPEWFTPRDLMELLATDADAAARGLAEDGLGTGRLRPYQEEAIKAIEDAIVAGQRDILVSMATGTGKTRTAIALMYRLLKHGRFRRILFLVDRKALGKQTSDALATTEIEGLLNFAQIYKVAGLGTGVPEVEDRVQVATVQSMIARVVREPDPARRPTPGTFDCVIVDEAHRGYTLDAELREEDIGFRDLEDYQSAYRHILDYFSAVKVALTATPALHTREIFGPAVFHYGYRQAVVEGYLIDHLPPRRITTALSQAGITFEGGEEVEVIDRRTGQIDLFTLPDEVSRDFEVGEFNKKVYSEAFNRIVAEAIAREIPPDKPGKTLIFAARDTHADDMVALLTEALREEYGEGAVPADMVMKITGSVDNADDLILKFKNDPYPKYVVTVDLLTTGVDVPSICNLVFVRRVRSRILYDQMIGRATRLCPEIGKETFRILDAVDLYADLQEMSDMRPVVVRPNISLGQLVADLAKAETDDDRTWVAGQVIVRMRALSKRMDDEAYDGFVHHTGETPEAAVQRLAKAPGATLLEWLRAYPRAVDLLERRSRRGGGDGVWISTHEDELLRIEEVFGKNTTPEDYITGFERFVRENMNRVPALIAVTQRPRDLTRKQLSELAGLLDEKNYSESMLRAAYGKARNADIAAHIIGFVRQAALGDPLVPYEKRVDDAIARIEARGTWTKDQKRWLYRIGRALRDKPVADPSLLEQGVFADKGGFGRISQEFDGKLDEVLRTINEAIWPPSAA